MLFTKAAAAEVNENADSRSSAPGGVLDVEHAVGDWVLV